MNKQNRRAKRVSQMSDLLFLQYYIRFNQPQIREAVVTEIRTNGVIIQIPFFDLKLPIQFIRMTGEPEEWVKETYHSNEVTIQVDEISANQITDSEKKGISGTKTRITVKNVKGDVLVQLALYQRIEVRLTVTIVNRNTNAMRIDANIVSHEPITQEEDSDKCLKDLMKECNAFDKKSEYITIQEGSDLNLENTRQQLLEQIKTILRRPEMKEYLVESEGSSEVLMKSQLSRFQFGGFVTPKSTLLAKWREEYEGFNEGENQEEVLNRRQIRKEQSRID